MTKNRLIIILLSFIAINTLASIFSIWESIWWLILFIDFILVVAFAEQLGTIIPLKHQKLYQRALAISFPIFMLITWELIVNAGILNPRWFPPPSKIAAALWDLTVNYDRFNKTSLFGRPWLIPSVLQTQGWSGVWPLFTESHVLTTLWRVFAGFIIGAIPGILLGIIMGLNKTIRMMLDATMSAVYVLPKIAIFPIMMLIFPNPFGEGPKIAVVAISAFFLVAISTMAGVRDIDPVFLQVAKNFGANRRQTFWHVIVPGALPIIFSGLRLALGTALIVIVAIEFIRAQIGVGFVVFYHWQILATDKMYAGLFVVMMLGILFTFILQAIERWVMPWRK